MVKGKVHIKWKIIKIKYNGRTKLKLNQWIMII